MTITKFIMMSTSMAMTTMNTITTTPIIIIGISSNIIGGNGGNGQAHLSHS